MKRPATRHHGVVEKWIFKWFLMGTFSRRFVWTKQEEVNVLSCGEWRSLFEGIRFFFFGFCFFLSCLGHDAFDFDGISTLLRPKSNLTHNRIVTSTAMTAQNRLRAKFYFRSSRLVTAFTFQFPAGGIPLWRSDLKLCLCAAIVENFLEHKQDGRLSPQCRRASFVDWVELPLPLRQQ